MHVGKRILQDYRDISLLRYVQLPGKIIYRESDVKKSFKDHYHKSM